jgi:hypothetical protein
MLYTSISAVVPLLELAAVRPKPIDLPSGLKLPVKKSCSWL